MQVNKLIQYCILTLIFVCVFLLNHLTPMTLDDCGYALNVNNFADILKHQYRDYFEVNGRFFSHVIVQLFCGLIGKDVFNIFNALMYVILVVLILKHAEMSKSAQNKILVLLGSFFLCWFFLPDQYITTLLIAGSLNYVWASSLLLAYILFFREYVVPGRFNHWYGLLIIPVFSFFPGAFVEMYAVCVLPSLVVWLFIHKIRLNRSIWMAMGGFTAGTAMVVLAPGNFARLNNTGEPAIHSIQNKTLGFISNLLNEEFIVVAVTLSIILLLFFKPFRIKIREFVMENIFYLSSILFSLLFIFVSGAGWSRPFFAVYVFLFILIIKLVDRVRMHNTIKVVVSAAIVLFLLSDFYREYNTLKHNRDIYNSLVNQLTDKEAEVVFCMSDPLVSRKNNTEILSLSPHSWKNKSFSAYHSHRDVACLSREIYDSLYSFPSFADKRFEECHGCFSAPALAYYIFPVADGVKIRYVNLSYSDCDFLYVPKRQVKRFLDLVGLDDLIYQRGPNEDNGRIKNILYKKVSSFVNLNEEQYTILRTSHGAYVVAGKTNPVTKYGGPSMKLKWISFE